MVLNSFCQSYPSSLSGRPTVLSSRDRTSPSPARQAGYLSLLSTGTSAADLLHRKRERVETWRCTKWGTRQASKGRTHVLLQAELVLIRQLQIWLWIVSLSSANLWTWNLHSCGFVEAAVLSIFSPSSDSVVSTWCSSTNISNIYKDICI